jgi:hypothetical protein
MEDALSASLTQRRLSALLTGSFAALALLLVAVGVYGAAGLLLPRAQGDEG